MALKLPKRPLAAVRDLLTSHRTEADAAPDVLTLLMAQHREADALFHSLLTASGRAVKEKQRMVKELEQKLRMHMYLEETFFYPQVKTIDDPLVHEAFEEHAAVETALQRLVATKPKDEFFTARVTVLKEIVHHHVKEEETDLFPKVRSEWTGERLRALGERMQRAMADTPQVAAPAAAATKITRLTSKRPKPVTTRKAPSAVAAARKKTTRAKAAPSGRAAPRRAKKAVAAEVTKGTKAKKTSRKSTRR